MKYVILLAICFLSIGCSTKEMTYTTTGTAIGAGVGYSQDKDEKQAVIGGLSGGIVGYALEKYHTKSTSEKQKKSFDEGYNQAKLDLALNNWDENTGKQSEAGHYIPKRIVPVKIKEQNINGVQYESHVIQLEDYR